LVKGLLPAGVPEEVVRVVRQNPIRVISRPSALLPGGPWPLGHRSIAAQAARLLGNEVKIGARHARERPRNSYAPRQVRDFGRASGKLAKTDTISAAILAHFGA
jgi:hypothetical protein